jgi:hypothetical protein
MSKDSDTVVSLQRHLHHFCHAPDDTLESSESFKKGQCTKPNFQAVEGDSKSNHFLHVHYILVLRSRIIFMRLWLQVKFHAVPAPASTLLYSKAKCLKRNKV